MKLYIQVILVALIAGLTHFMEISKDVPERSGTSE